MSIGIILGISNVILAIWIVIERLNHYYHIWDWLKGPFGRNLIFSTGRVLTEVRKIAENIKKSCFCPEMVVGIGGGDFVGGVIVASFLASPEIGFGILPVTSLELVRDAEGKPKWDQSQSIFNNCEKYIKIKRRQQILIVDDMAIGGNTIDKVVEELKNRLPNREIRVATLVAKPQAIKKFDGKDYWSWKFCSNPLKKDKRVRFPWRSETG